MRDINPKEVKLATLEYHDSSSLEHYYIHIEFVKPIKLDDWDKEPVKGVYTFGHRTPEAAEQNFRNLFKQPSDADKVKKRTLIDACGFIY